MGSGPPPAQARRPQMDNFLTVFRLFCSRKFPHFRQILSKTAQISIFGQLLGVIHFFRPGAFCCLQLVILAVPPFRWVVLPSLRWGGGSDFTCPFIELCPKCKFGFGWVVVLPPGSMGPLASDGVHSPHPGKVLTLHLHPRRMPTC